MQSIQDKILSRIYGHKGGWVFSPRNFLDLGSRQSVGVALQRLVHDRTIRRVARGLYDYPKQHPILGTLAPSPDAVAKAIAGKENIRLQPSGAYAANVLGLSEQVPAKIVFLTDGPYKTVRIGNQQIQLKRTTPRNMTLAGRVSGSVVEALRYLGKRHVDEDVISKLRHRLGAEEKRQLLKDLPIAPTWMGHYFREIASPAE